MRILQINPLPGNPIPPLYEAKLAARHHTIATFRPSTAGASRPLPIKAVYMPRRVLSLERVVGKMRKRDFDVAHIHWASYGLLGLGSRIPYIVHCHGSDVRYRLRKPLYRAALRPAMEHASAVLYATPDLAESVRLVRPDAIFMPVPIDVAQFAPEEVRPSRPYTVLLHGRLEAGKGSDVAMEGIMRFAERHADTRIIAMDWGKLSGELKQRYGHRVDFLARVPPERMREIMAQTDIVVGQFVLGALGLSEFESMSCAKPVIASFRFPGIYDTPPPIAEATTEDEIDHWLEHLYTHPDEATKLGREARAWVQTHHDSEMLLDRLETLYASALWRP